MVKIEVDQGQFIVLFNALNWRKLKTDEDYHSSYEVRKVMKSLVGEPEFKPGGVVNYPVKIKAGKDGQPGEKATLVFENSAWRFLKKAFEDARADGDVYAPMNVENVISAMKLVEAAKEEDSPKV